MRKLLFISFVLGLILTVALNSYEPANILTSDIGKSVVTVGNIEGEKELFSFAAGSIIEYFIIVFAIYLFLRGIFKSFDRQR